MNITSFDRTNLRLISEDIKIALASVATKYGITFEYKGARFLENNATFKIEGNTVGTDGIINNKERSDFIDYASLYSLQPTDLDKEFINGGKNYKVKGLNTRRSKFPIVCERIEDGKTILFPQNTVQFSLSLMNKVTSPTKPMFIDPPKSI